MIDRPVVLLTAPIEVVGEAELKSFAEVILASNREPDTIRRMAGEADGIIACSPVPEDIFEHAPKLRALVRHGAGYDILPVAEAFRRGVSMAYVPGANAGSVAEHAVGMMFELARRYGQVGYTLRQAGWAAARALPIKPVELAGKRLGIVGVGAIGTRIAEIAHFGLKMHVGGYQRRADHLPSFVEALELDRLFRDSDIVVLSCPLTAQTAKLVDESRFASMKPSAFLVNVSRGGLIDETALIDALRRRVIAGAGLDVFAEEPLPAQHPILALDNVVLTPHQAGASPEARVKVSALAVAEMKRLLAGQAALNPVPVTVLQ